MLNINLIDFIKESILNGKILELNWHLFMFTKITDNEIENDYIKIHDKEFYVKVNDEFILITKDYRTPIMKYNNKLEINKSFLVNINNPITTTVGRLILNYLIGTVSLNNKIEFINKMFTFKEVEALITKKYDDKDENGIHTPEYKEFLDMRLFIDTFANYLSIGVTEHSLKPAPGIKKFLDKTIKELVKEYGNDELNNNPTIFKKLEDAVIAYDIEYLKTDIAYGKIVTKKVTNMARKRMYAVYGIGLSLKGKANPIFSSLADGLKKDGIELAGYFNDARGGSYGRGMDTRDSGALTKFLIRATSDIVIDLNDCKTKLTLTELITNDNSYDFIDRYILIADKPLLLTKDNIDKYVGKKVSLRDPYYCVSESGLCVYCAGEKFRDYQDFMPILSTSLGGLFLGASLKKFHGISLEVTTITPESLI